MAKVYLDPGDEYRIVNENVTVYGSSDNEQIIVESGADNVVADANVERVDFAGDVSDFTFKQAGNQLLVYDSEGNEVAQVGVQEDGTELAFTNGLVELTLDPDTHAMLLGGAEVSADEAAAVEPTEIDESQTSEAGTGGGTGGETGEYTITADATSVEEGNAVTFTVTVSEAPESDVTLSYKIDGVSTDAYNAADPISDLGKITGQVTIPAGETQAQFTLTPSSDEQVEGFEGFKVTLLDSSFNVLGTSSNIVILDKSEASSGETYTLTTSADAYNGTPYDDTFVANETTLSSADVLDGGDGTDTLRYASSGNAAVNESGFEAQHIEVVQITSDAINGTAFDVTGVTDIETLRNYNSSEDLRITGADKIFDLELVNVGSAGAGANDPTPDTTIIYDSAVVAGSDDEMNILLNGNVNVDGTNIGDVIVNGIEKVNITTTGAASQLNSIISNTLADMVIKGDQDLTLQAVNFANNVGLNHINASEFTGDLNVTAANSGVVDVSVDGGSGDDRADFSNGFDKDDAFDGGEGTDTLVLANAVATGTPAGTVSNVEVLEVSTPGTGTIDMDNFAGITKVIYNADIAAGATATVDDAPSGIVVDVNVGASPATNGNLVVDLKTNGNDDEISVNLTNVQPFEGLASIDAADAETFKLSADDTTLAGNGSVTINNMTITEAKTLTISGDADITINNVVDPATPILTKIDASEATGDLNIWGVNTSANGATIILGSGDDTFNVATSNGADIIDLTKGGSDTIFYNDKAQSDSDMDVIKGFTSGDDVVDVRALLGGVGFASSTQFVGNKPTFGQAQGALLGAGNPPSAVFQQDDQILWVDTNMDGTLDNRDFRVKLEGVTSLTAADLGFVPGVTFTANKVGFNIANPNDSVEGVAATPEDDIINATVAQLAGATLIDTGGTDTLNISGTAAANEIADLTTTLQFNNIEKINIDSNTEGLKLNAGDYAANVGGFVTAINGTSGVNQSLTVVGGDNLSQTTISNIETLNMTGNVTMTASQHNAFLTINAPTAADQITLTTAGTIQADPDVETYSIVEGSTITLGALGQSVIETEVTGNVATTIIFGAGAYTGAAFNGIDPTDILQVVNNTDLSGTTGLTQGRIDFSNSNATITLDNNQIQNMSFINTGGVQTINGTVAANFAVADGIENYNLIGGSTVQVTATNPGVNIITSGAAPSTVTINAGVAATGQYALLTGADNMVLNDNSDISQVNNGADTTAEKLTINDTNGDGKTTVTMTTAQYNAFKINPITAAAASDTITLTDTTTNSNADASVENYILNGTGNDTFTISETADNALTDAIRNNMSVDLAGGGVDTVVIDTANVADRTDASIDIFNFTTGEDKLQLSVGPTPASNGTFVNDYDGTTAINFNSGDVIEIDATNFQFGTADNTDAVKTWLNNAGVVGATAGGSDYGTVVAYNGNGEAAIYLIEDTSNDGVDNVELIGIVHGVADNSFVGADFA